MVRLPMTHLHQETLRLRSCHHASLDRVADSLIQPLVRQEPAAIANRDRRDDLNLPSQFFEPTDELTSDRAIELVVADKTHEAAGQREIGGQHGVSVTVRLPEAEGATRTRDAYQFQKGPVGIGEDDEGLRRVAAIERRIRERKPLGISHLEGDIQDVARLPLCLGNQVGTGVDRHQLADVRHGSRHGTGNNAIPAPHLQDALSRLGIDPGKGVRKVRRVLHDDSLVLPFQRVYGENA